MSYKVKLTQSVAEIVSNLHPEIKKLVKLSLHEIADNPYIGKELQEELAGFFTFRFKRYRTIYKVDEEGKNIITYMVGHRRDVYELFAELVNLHKLGR